MRHGRLRIATRELTVRYLVSPGFNDVDLSLTIMVGGTRAGLKLYVQNLLACKSRSYNPLAVLNSAYETEHFLRLFHEMKGRVG